MSKFGIPNNQADFYYDFLGWDIDAVEANNWKLPDGTDFQNRRRTCLKRHQKRMDAVRIIRTTVAPIIILLFIVFATVFFMCNVRIGDVMAQISTFPPLVVLVTSVCLAFSPALSYGKCSVVMSVRTYHPPDSRKSTLHIII